MSAAPITNVLLVDDCAEDARAILASLDCIPDCAVRLTWKQDLKSALAECSDKYRAVVMNVRLPDAEGLDAIKKFAQAAEHFPVIVLASADDSDFALQCVDAGAQDYLVKGTINGAMLVRSIFVAIRRSQIRSRLAEMQERFILATQGSNEGIWDWDPSSNLNYWSPRFYGLMGYENGEIPSSKEAWLDRIHPDDVAQVEKAIREHLDNNAPYEVEYRARKKNGQYSWFQTRGTSVRDEHGNVLRMAGTIRDISEKKAAEDQHKRLLLLEQQRDFLATLTHDLKNPLLGAERIFELLMDGAFGALTLEQESIMQGLRKSNHALLDMIQNYIELYRIGQLTFNRNVGETDVKELLAEIATEYDAIAQSKGIDLVYTLDEAPPAVAADDSSIRRLISNLVGNALKYTPAGGHVDVLLKDEAKKLSFIVQDTGPGIPAEELEKLYRRFSRVGNGRTVSDGSGLGLYVCNKIVESLGGNIHCESEVGKGTKFVVTLPAVTRVMAS